jgi:hypothetical protein
MFSISPLFFCSFVPLFLHSFTVLAIERWWGKHSTTELYPTPICAYWQQVYFWLCKTENTDNSQGSRRVKHHALGGFQGCSSAAFRLLHQNDMSHLLKMQHPDSAPLFWSQMFGAGPRNLHLGALQVFLLQSKAWRPQVAEAWGGVGRICVDESLSGKIGLAAWTGGVSTIQDGGEWQSSQTSMSQGQRRKPEEGRGPRPAGSQEEGRKHELVRPVPRLSEGGWTWVQNSAEGLLKDSIGEGPREGGDFIFNYYFFGGTRAWTQGLVRQALHHLSHEPRHFALGYFSDRVFLFAQVGWDCAPPIYASCAAGVTGACYHAQLIYWDGGVSLTFFCLG